MCAEKGVYNIFSYFCGVEDEDKTNVSGFDMILRLFLSNESVILL